MLILFACLICALVFLAALPVRLGALKLPERALRLGITVGFVRIQTDVYFEFQNAVPTERKDAPRRSETETELLAVRHTTDCPRPHSGKTGRRRTKVDFCPDRPEFCRGLFRVY